jgi:hypothetical protein
VGAEDDEEVEDDEDEDADGGGFPCDALYATPAAVGAPLLSAELEPCVLSDCLIASRLSLLPFFDFLPVLGGHIPPIDGRGGADLMGEVWEVVEKSKSMELRSGVSSRTGGR